MSLLFNPQKSHHLSSLRAHLAVLDCKVKELFLNNKEKRGIIWKLQRKFVSLQRERNLFRVRAPFGSASDLLK